MLKPSENIITVPHKSTYSLVIAVAKRARQIAQKAEDEGLILTDKPVDGCGRVTFSARRLPRRTGNPIQTASGVRCACCGRQASLSRLSSFWREQALQSKARNWQTCWNEVSFKR